DKKLNPKHYTSLLEYVADIGIVNGFVQDEGTNTTDYVPSFKNEGVMP
ncbi:MAG: radical SAM protein, partial [Clostridium sp.]